jgi:hypothetical protein
MIKYEIKVTFKTIEDAQTEAEAIQQAKEYFFAEHDIHGLEIFHSDVSLTIREVK